VIDLYAATTLQPSRVKTVDEETDTGLTCCGGDFLGDLHGDGDLLAYDTWTECSTTDPEGGAKCKRNGEPWMHSTVMNERLWRIEGLRRKAIRSGRGSFEAAAVDAGRIAVLEPSGAVRIVRADGSLVHRLVLAQGEAVAAQLSGSQLVVFTAAALKVYDAATGAAKKTLPLGAAAGGTLADFDHGVAVFVERRTVRLLRLADGHRIAITPPGKGRVFAQLEPAGLFVGYTVRSGKRRGRVDFTTRARLEQRLTG
jgi:hypothetical protein